MFRRIKFRSAVTVPCSECLIWTEKNVRFTAVQSENLSWFHSALTKIQDLKIQVSVKPELGSKSNSIKLFFMSRSKQHEKFFFKQTNKGKKKSYNSSIRKRKIHFIIHFEKKLFKASQLKFSSIWQFCTIIYKKHNFTIIFQCHQDCESDFYKTENISNTHIQIIRFPCVFVTLCPLQL